MVNGLKTQDTLISQYGRAPGADFNIEKVHKFVSGPPLP